MLGFTRIKIWSVLAVLLFGVIFSFPNFFPEKMVSAWPEWAPRDQLNLGLDLRGGSYILLEGSEDDVRKARLQVLEEVARSELRDAEGGPIRYADMGISDKALGFNVREPADLDRAVKTMRAVARPVGQLSAERDLDVSVVKGDRVLVTPTDAGLTHQLDTAMKQAVEVIRRRVDEMGTREPTIIRQGSNRIVVQVPGLQNPQELKDLLGKTAKLEFKLVDVSADMDEARKGRAPAGSQVVPDAETGEPVVVNRRIILSGDQLIDSEQTFQEGMPVVSFRFDAVGARRFAKVTRDNVGRPFAIILDGKVISAPRINTPILGGSGVITGNFTTQSANELAVLLRSGRLPIDLKVVEERTVGPDLGADSIRAGTIAGVVGTVAVAIIMVVVYGLFGVFAVVALVFNLLLIIGAMSLLGATLTLPGIAGLVLTVGTAVDANVLINERIREEQLKGKGRGVYSTIEIGFREATRTIWDANSLNIIVAIIMFSFGTGPVKGFAVVLAIGIVSSVFTNVTVVRLMVAEWLDRVRPKALKV